MRSTRVLPLLLSILFSFSALITAAQEFYGYEVSGKFIKVSVGANNCGTVSYPTSCIATGHFTSIAMRDDTIYCTDMYSTLRKAQFVNGTISNCTTIGQVPTGINALTMDTSGMLYGAAGSALYRINPQNGATTFLGAMPYFSGGDLAFYQGQLYMAALGPKPGIVKVDINTPLSSTLYIPMTQNQIVGLANVAVSCNQNKLYAQNSSGNSTQIIELDMVNATVVGVVCTIPYGIGDAASIVESGIFAGINISSIKVLPECSNSATSGSVQVNTFSSNSAYTFRLNNTANTTGLFTSLTPGTYTIHISTANGCSRDTAVTVPAADTPNIQVQTTPTFCSSSSGSISVAATSAAPPFAYTINQGTGQSGSTFPNLAAGNYFIQVRDSNRCTARKTAIVQANIPPLFRQISVAATTCGANNGAIDIVAVGSVSATHSINNGSPQSAGQFNNLAPGNYLVSTFTTQGCRYDTLITINSTPFNITYNITPTPALCQQSNGALLITATNVQAYSINNGLQQASGQFQNLAAGSYLVSLFTPAGCRTDTTITVARIRNTAPSIQLLATAPNCYGRRNGQVMVLAGGTYAPFSYSLSGSNFVNENTFTDLQSSRYQLQIRDVDGCVFDTGVTIPAYIPNPPVVTFQKNIPTCLMPQTGAIQLYIAGSSAPYQVGFQNLSYPANHLFNNLSSGSYLFQVSDSTNCIVQSVSVDLPLTYLPECDSVYVPTAFTPDRNGTNDVFKAIAYGSLLQFSITVYNRLGQLIFRSQNVNAGWDGKVNGMEQPTGAYIWMMDYRFGNKPPQKKHGTVMLIR